MAYCRGGSELIFRASAFSALFQSVYFSVPIMEKIQKIKTCAFACYGQRFQVGYDMKVANRLNASGRGEGNNVSPSNLVFFLYKN